MIPEKKRNRYWSPPANTPREHSNTVNRVKKIFLKEPRKFFRDKVILDAGCGWGDASRYMIVEGQAKTVIGVDVNLEALHVLKDKFKKEFEGYNLKFLERNIYDTKFDDNMFDLIVCTEVIEHMDTDELILTIKEFKRILKKDGRVWISTPKKRFEKKNNLEGRGSHWIEYDEKEVTQLFFEYGFWVNWKDIHHDMFFMFKHL